MLPSSYRCPRTYIIGRYLQHLCGFWPDTHLSFLFFFFFIPLVLRALFYSIDRVIRIHIYINIILYDFRPRHLRRRRRSYRVRTKKKKPPPLYSRIHSEDICPIKRMYDKRVYATGMHCYRRYVRRTRANLLYNTRTYDNYYSSGFIDVPLISRMFLFVSCRGIRNLRLGCKPISRSRRFNINSPLTLLVRKVSEPHGISFFFFFLTISPPLPSPHPPVVLLF